MSAATDSEHKLPALDGLRALAILLVVWHHVYRWGPDDWGIWKLPVIRASADFGFIGVMLFFVLSGFLLFLPYGRALAGGSSWPSARRFYRRRALRILPVYFVALAVMAALVSAAHAWRPWMPTGFIFSFLLLQNVSGSASNLVGVLDGPLWTLAIEWQFYLILPLIAMALARMTIRVDQRTGLQRTYAALVILIAAGLATRVLSALVFYTPAGRHIASPGSLPDLALTVISGHYVEDFALGMLLSVAYIELIERRSLQPRYLKHIGTLALLAVLPGLVACYFWARHLGVFRAENDWGYVPQQGWSWVVLGVWVTAVCFSLLLAATLFGSDLLKRALSLPPLRFIGLISYSIYVWHLPIINLVRTTWLALLVVLLLSVLSYYAVERPFLKRRYTAPAHVRESAAAIIPG